MAQVDIVGILASEVASPARILEVGSHAGGGVRHLFPSSEYQAADITPGRQRVDFSTEGRRIEPSDQFDLTISCDSFQHIPYWLEALTLMEQMTKDGGTVIVTCPARKWFGRKRSAPEALLHALGADGRYYRDVTEADFRMCLVDRMFADCRFVTDSGLCFIGRKRAA